MTGATQTPADVVFRHAERVMGTVVSFDIRPRGLAYERTRAALAQACELLHRTDDMFSLYRPQSPLSRLRRGELTLADCPPDVSDVLALCEQARELSDGWFDPWALPGGVDPTGLVKGWAAQHAARALRDAGVGAAMVNAAGDIVVFGQPAPKRSWQIGVRSADDPNRLLCIVEGSQAVATSGNYERGEQVRDARTGGPASGALSATVCGPDLAFADAFATGFRSSSVPGSNPLTSQPRCVQAFSTQHACTKGPLAAASAASRPPSGAGGGGQSMPDGTTPEPGGWNRFMLEIPDVAMTASELHGADGKFRNEHRDRGRQPTDSARRPFRQRDRAVRTDPTQGPTLPKPIHGLGERRLASQSLGCLPFPRPVASPRTPGADRYRVPPRRTRRCRSGSIPLSSRDATARAHTRSASTRSDDLGG